jgi:hypothetical protein
MKIIKLNSLIVFSLLLSIYTSLSYAGSVSATNIWLNKYQDESSNVEYAFFTDIWGTVDEFQSITITSPLNDSYSLSLSEEGNQWGSDFVGTQAEVESLFTDGLYTFDVTYTDTTTESIDVILGGVLPVYPTNISLNGNLVTWDEWLTPTSPSHIEFLFAESGDGPSVGSSFLPFTDTSFAIPEGFLKDNSLYDLEVWFVSSENPSAFKASVSTISVSTVPLPGAVWFFSSGLIALIVVTRRKAFA